MKVLVKSHHAFGDGLFHVKLLEQYYKKNQNEKLFLHCSELLRECIEGQVSHIKAILCGDLTEEYEKSFDKVIEFRIRKGFEFMRSGKHLGEAYGLSTEEISEITREPWRLINIIEPDTIDKKFWQNKIIINPFTGTERKKKEWNIKYWDRLISLLHDEYPDIEFCIVCGNGDDCNSYAMICQVFQGRSIKQVAGWLKYCKAYIGIDSGLTWLAWIVGQQKICKIQAPYPRSWSGFRREFPTQIMIKSEFHPDEITPQQVFDAIKYNRVIE